MGAAGHFAPIHGETKHQLAHARWPAGALGLTAERIHVLDNGDVLELDGERAAVVDEVRVGLTYVDQAGGGDVTESVLRDRRHLSDDGLVLVLARIDASDGSSSARWRVTWASPRATTRSHRGDPPRGRAEPRRLGREW